MATMKYVGSGKAHCVLVGMAAFGFAAHCGLHTEYLIQYIEVKSQMIFAYCIDATMESVSIQNTFS